MRIEVGDNGAGISGDPSDHARIFDAFFTQKARGTGLGLAVAAQVLEAHDGGVEVARTGPGGTVFRAWVPACDPVGPSVSSGLAS